MGKSVLIAVVAFFAYIYIAAPIRIKRRFRTSTRPEFIEVDPEHALLPEALKSFFRDTGAELEGSGFAHLTTLIVPQLTPGMTAYMSVFENRGTGDIAAATVCFADATRAVRACAVEFTTEFIDDTEIATSNTPDPTWVGDTARRKIYRVPGMGDVEQLYRVHQAVIQRHGKGADKRLPQAGRYTAKLRESLIREFEGLVEQGRLCLAGNGEAYCHTWKAAYLGTWARLWPVSVILRWRVRRRARALLRELGFPKHYQTVDYRSRFKQERASPGLQVTPPTLAPEETPPAASTSRFRCPACGGLIEADQAAGGQVRCPFCQQAVAVPQM